MQGRGAARLSPCSHRCVRAPVQRASPRRNNGGRPYHACGAARCENERGSLTCFIADMMTHITQMMMQRMERIGMTTNGVELWLVKHTSGLSSASRIWRFIRTVPLALKKSQLTCK
jgi:hypothetical protein